MPLRAAGGAPGLVRRQQQGRGEAGEEILGLSLYRSFCGKGKAGQGKHFKIGWFE